MSVVVTLPQLGESVLEGTIARWLVKEGDRVERDQPLVEVTTDKVDAEIPAPEAGVIEAILAPEGATSRWAPSSRASRAGRGAPRRPRPAAAPAAARRAARACAAAPSARRPPPARARDARRAARGARTPASTSRGIAASGRRPAA